MRHDRSGLTLDLTTRDIRPFSLHKLKKMGVDLEQVMVSAGHKKQATTEDYLIKHAEYRSEESLPPLV